MEFKKQKNPYKALGIGKYDGISNEIEIIITGARNSGKTKLSIFILDMLKEAGIKVSYVNKNMGLKQSKRMINKRVRTDMSQIIKETLVVINDK